MKLYTRIDAAQVAELFSTDQDITTLFHPSIIWVDVTSINPPPQVGYAAVKANGTWSFSPPSGPSASSLWSDYQGSALAALNTTDATILRCAENAVAVPAAWASYRKALRAIVGAATGDPTKPLPTRPCFPAGT